MAQRLCKEPRIPRAKDHGKEATWTTPIGYAADSKPIDTFQVDFSRFRRQRLVNLMVDKLQLVGPTCPSKKKKKKN